MSAEPLTAAPRLNSGRIISESTVWGTQDERGGTRTMRAAVVAGPRTIRIEEINVPEPGAEQVRIKLEGCGVCGSNLAPWEGRPWFKYPLAPGELGHEGWGVIDEVGSKVTDLKKGDRVSVLSYRAYAEYDVAHQLAVIPLPGALNDQPFPGEALGCALNVFERCDIRSGQTVAIVGIGFLGAVLTELSVQAGARVIAISRRGYALSVARAMGASETIPMRDHQEIIAEVKRLTEGNGCERVIEAVGQQWPLDLAGELTRERGRLIIAGYHQDGPRNVNMQLWNWRGIDVVNAHEREQAVYVEGVRRAVKAVATGALNPGKLYTHHFPLEELGEALDAMRERPANFLKALIRI
jgi:threonine dehydrogenase-like Zn-dependent dehydrogenase